jgi:hypothetical protein
MASGSTTSMMCSSSMTPYKYNSGIAVASAVKSVQAKRMLNVYIEVNKFVTLFISLVYTIVCCIDLKDKCEHATTCTYMNGACVIPQFNAVLLVEHTSTHVCC